MTTLPVMDWGYGDAMSLRETYARDREAIVDQAAPNVSVEEVSSITGASLWFKTENPSGAPILYFHGGGWVAGSPRTHITLCSWLSALSNRLVLSVPYGLCPEYKFPSQRHDGARALDDFLRTQDDCIVMGDSAGGAMAFWAESHATHRARVKGVVSLYGAFGAMDTPSMLAISDQDDGLKRRDMVGMYERLGCPMGHGILDNITPKGAPALLVTAGADSLADDHKMLAEHLDRDVQEITAKNQPHAFLQFCGSDAAAKATMEKIATIIAAWG